MTPEMVAAIRLFVPLLRRARRDGWDHIAYQINDSVPEHVWRLGSLRAEYWNGSLDLGGQWRVPVRSAGQVAETLRLAGFTAAPVRCASTLVDDADHTHRCVLYVDAGPHTDTNHVCECGKQWGGA